MVKLYEGGAYLLHGTEVIADAPDALAAVKSKTGIETTKEAAAKETMAYGILSAHNTSGNMQQLQIKFDKLTSHDITFVGIIQTARASGLEKFPIPYVLTNCHNSLCAVGGTINEDDHMFGLSAAKKYGGIYVPPHIAVIHQYMREMMAGCGKMILGSDSHTRYGALGTMAIGEGGGELVKQLLRDTYDVAYPGVIAVYLDGCPKPGTGPQDIALAISYIGEDTLDELWNSPEGQELLSYLPVTALGSEGMQGADGICNLVAFWLLSIPSDSKVLKAFEKALEILGADFKPLSEILISLAGGVKKATGFWEQVKESLYVNLGIGNNGHIAFNEASDHLIAVAHTEKLTESTINANARFFEKKEDVPTMAITMGMGDILAAKKVVLAATGLAKVPAIKGLIMDDVITTQNPSTMLKMHEDAVVVIDRELADAVGYRA